MKCKKLPIKIGDVVLCVIIFALAAVIFFSLNDRFEPSQVVVSYGGETHIYDLFSDREIEINSQGYRLKIIIENGSVRVEESDCPDKICKASDAISSASGMIACVPAGVSIKIEGDSDEKIDWIAP